MTATKEPEIRETTVVDGYIVDVETGDILGLAGKEAFRVTDEDSANWVLEKRLDAQTEIVRLKQKLATVVDRMNVEIKAQQRRVEFLDRAYGADLEELAKARLAAINEGKPESRWKKSINLLWGKLGFRATKGGLKVKDEAEAIRIARFLDENQQPFLPEECLKETVEFRISAIPEDKLAEIIGTIKSGKLDDDDLLLEAFEVVEDSEKFYIDGGVK